MDDTTLSGDWLDGMQDAFYNDLNRLRDADAITLDEFTGLTQALLPNNAQPKVHQLWIGRKGERLSNLAGCFVVTPGSSTLRIFMYAPVRGLEIFATELELTSVLEQRLSNPLLREDLLRFTLIEDRASLIAAKPLNIRLQAVYGNVFADCAQAVFDTRRHNLEGLDRHLAMFPSLRQVLNDGLKEQLDLSFQGMDLLPSSVVVDSFEQPVPPEALAVGTASNQVVSITASAAPQRVSSMSLSDAALLYYTNDGWPNSQTRWYHSPTVRVADLSKLLDKQMQALVKSVTQGLEAKMKAITAAFWSYSFNGLSLRTWGIQVIGDRFFNELLHARHKGVITREQFAGFKVPYALDPMPGAYWCSNWKAVKLSLTDSNNVLIEFAGLFNAYLPGSSGEVFLCCHSRGMERFAKRTELTGALRERLRPLDDEGSLMSHVSLDQQAIFEQLQNRNLKVGVSVIDQNLFENVLQTIVDKQSRDIGYLLVKAKERAADLDATIDQALDVRVLLDPQLLSLGSQGRWSTRLELDPLRATT